MSFSSRMRVLWRMTLKWLDWKPWYVPLFPLLLNLIKTSILFVVNLRCNNLVFLFIGIDESSGIVSIRIISGLNA